VPIYGIDGRTTYYYPVLCHEQLRQRLGWLGLKLQDPGSSRDQQRIGANYIRQQHRAAERQFDGGHHRTVTIYWGDTDGGTTPGSCGAKRSLGVQSEGAFSTILSVIDPKHEFYYRCYASNAVGTAWAGSSATFVTLDSLMAAWRHQPGSRSAV